VNEPQPPPKPGSQPGRGHIVVLIRDLFFSVKVKNELDAAGYSTVLVKREAGLLSTVESINPSLVLIDLGTRPDWDTLAPIVEARESCERPPVIAFGPHKDVAARRAAQTAGADRVLTNQQLHRNLLDYVDRYARRS
jgi:DNA-binding response OmpR family regulator